MKKRDSDRVDQGISDWRRERPDLDLSVAGVTLRMVLIGKYLEQNAARSFAQFDLQSWEFDVLAALRRQGEPYALPAGELARNVVMTCSGMTHRLDRLEARGLVERVSAPEDRRRVLVRLTPGGVDLTEQGLEARLRDAGELLSDFSPQERQKLEGLLRRLLLRLESTASESCSPPEKT